jgi:methylated-DNA-[protein]-cysteine S-methyltransferase
VSEKKEALNYKLCETCLGWMGVISSANGLKRVILPRKSKEELLDQITDCGCRPENHDSDSLADLTDRLTRYLRGEAEDFADRLDLSGTTGFQQRVWSIVRNIPRGETRSYGWIARQLGSPKAARAVGQAVGRNPLPIIIPCHRVISGNGQLGGFGGGLEIKKFLLNLERAA